MKRFFIAGALSVLVAMGWLVAPVVWVVAQQVTLPQAATVTPTLDLVNIQPKGQPSAQSIYVPTAAISATEQYAKVAITTASNYTTSPGYSNTFGNFQTDILVTAPGTLSYLYFTFAPNPSDGARECFYANQTVTNAYPTANTTINAQVINSNNTITSMTASTRYCWLYSASNLQWDRD